MFSFCVLYVDVQMSPTKHSVSKKSSKHARTDSDNFISTDADMAADVDMAYND